MAYDLVIKSGMIVSGESAAVADVAVQGETIAAPSREKQSPRSART
jgi:hypothetical protein